MRKLAGFCGRQKCCYASGHETGALVEGVPSKWNAHHEFLCAHVLHLFTVQLQYKPAAAYATNTCAQLPPHRLSRHHALAAPVDACMHACMRVRKCSWGTGRRGGRTSWASFVGLPERCRARAYKHRPSARSAAVGARTAGSRRCSSARSCRMPGRASAADNVSLASLYSTSPSSLSDAACTGGSASDVPA